MTYTAANKLRLFTVLVGAVISITVALLAVQSSVQSAQTQTGGQIAPATGDNPTYDGPEGKKFATGEIIVKIEEDASPADLRKLNRENGARTEEDLPKSDVNLVDLPRDLTVKEAVEVYEDSPDVEYAQPNYLLYPTRTPNDTYYARYLYGLDNTGQSIGGYAGTADADIDAPEAWDITTGSSSTVVAVIDTGVDVNHPDLKDNLWKNPGETPGNKIDDDGNGYVDDVNGWDFYNDDASVYDLADGDEHGTHVAGTIAARGNNSTGVAGVNWNARIMSLKFLGPNGGSTLDAVEAINYAVKKGVKISNNSWGGGAKNQALEDAIKRADAAGHLFVAAAGNGGDDAVGDNNDTSPAYPASYENPNVISVAATNNRDALAGFSNYGAKSVDLAAPGVDVVSTYTEKRYAYMSGTSMAAPHVAGVAALIKSQYPALDDAQIRARLLNSVDKKSNLTGKTSTGGRLNAAGALSVQDSAPPTVSPASTQLGVSVSRRAVNYGNRVALSGRLVTSSGKAVSGRQVVLQQLPVGARRYSSIARVTTASDGRFVLRGVRPAKNVLYRARFVGGEQFEGSRSTAKSVKVRPRLSLRTSTRNLKVNRGRKVAGAVAPHHRGSVKVKIRRNGKVVGWKKASLSRSRYAFIFRPKRPGVYSFRAVFPKHRDHLGTVSPVRKFRVVH